MARYQQFWDESYGRLDELLEALKSNQSIQTPQGDE
jgi:hypothetical protein